MWKFNGWRNIRDINLVSGEEEIISYGKVFDDRKSKIIRISFDACSKRLGITERTYLNGKNKYKTVCDVRTIDELHEYIINNYK